MDPLEPRDITADFKRYAPGLKFDRKVTLFKTPQGILVKGAGPHDPLTMNITQDGLINGALGYRFYKIEGNVDIYASGIGLTSLEKFPQEVDGNVNIAHNPELDSWDHLPVFYGNLDATHCAFTTLKGCRVGPGNTADLYGNKLVSYDGVEDMQASKVIFPYIQGLPALKMVVSKIDLVVMGDDDGHQRAGSDGEKLANILNHAKKLLVQGRNRAIMWAQKELVTAGLQNHAQW